MPQVPPPHPASLSESALRQQCRTERLRRSGPGGQHRNKVETAVVITHLPTGVAAEANERRSQAQNLEVAIARLRIRLAIACRTERHASQAPVPSDLWQSRRSGSKLVVSESHVDFATLLAEALDMLAAVDWDDRAAAERLQISRTQLIRFLGREPAALGMLNAARVERGQKPLS